MSISEEHKDNWIWIMLLDAYDSDGHLSGYSIGLTKYGNLEKWAEAIGIKAKAIKTDHSLTLNVTITYGSHHQST